MKISLDQIRARLNAIDQRRRFYEWKSEQPGRLKLHEVWRHAYLADPYLIGASEARLADRFRQIFMNLMELGPDGRITPVPFTATDGFMQIFTHMEEEYGSRAGGMPPELIERARAPFVNYWADGKPAGVRMFEGYNAPSGPILVKYGERRFLEPMLRAGEMRIANARHYRDTGLLEAARDDETSRTFYMPTYKLRLQGRTHVELKGVSVPINDDDIEIPAVFDDYHLFSLCEHVHHRMATDFRADAAIVIRDPTLFKQRVISAFLALRPDAIPMEGKVAYYDPYRGLPDFHRPEMTKHLGYSYQREIRIAFRSRREPSIPLEPVYLSIGPMTGYADLLPI